MNKYFRNPIFWIVAFGFLFRLGFFLIGAKYYFGRTDFRIDADSYNWLQMFENWIHHGVFSTNLNSEFGLFGRLPGYSIFMGIIYNITSHNMNLTLNVIVAIQLILDTLTILLIWKICLKIHSSHFFAGVASFLYASYPFIIVWTPVAYSESISIFLLVLSCYYFTDEDKPYNLIFAGIFAGLGVLFRPQIILLLPLFGIYILYQNKIKIRTLLIKGLLFSFGVLISYGPWPIRNYIVGEKVVLTQDLRGLWDEDVIAFMQYMYSLKSEWDPQFSNIIQNKEVSYPPHAYSEPEDSVKLAEATYLSKTCGSGFSQWNGYWKERFYEPNCNAQIAKLFTELRENQIKNHPVNFYLIIPLQNLKKALFKITLYSPKNIYVKFISSSLFLYRSILILLGLTGVLYMYFHKKRYVFLFGAYFLSLYLVLCFGTGVQYRNIEMRYFLHADILLLIPSAYSIYLFYMNIKNIRAKKIS